MSLHLRVIAFASECSADSRHVHIVICMFSNATRSAWLLGVGIGNRKTYLTNLKIQPENKTTYVLKVLHVSRFPSALVNIVIVWVHVA